MDKEETLNRKMRSFLKTALSLTAQLTLGCASYWSFVSLQSFPAFLQNGSRVVYKYVILSCFS